MYFLKILYVRKKILILNVYKTKNVNGLMIYAIPKIVFPLGNK